jgi:uncharacterized protein (DUF1778 family)
MGMASIEVTEDQMAWISQEAQQEGKSISQWVMDRLRGVATPNVAVDETFSLKDLEDDLKEVSKEKIYHSVDALFEDLDRECA